MDFGSIDRFGIQSVYALKMEIEMKMEIMKDSKMCIENKSENENSKY